MPVSVCVCACVLAGLADWCVDARWNVSPAPVADVNRKCAREHAASSSWDMCYLQRNRAVKPLRGPIGARIKKVVYDNGPERERIDNDQHVNMNVDKQSALPAQTCAGTDCITPMLIMEPGPAFEVVNLVCVVPH